ncbi:ABC transporter ATP-binding protein [Actinotalea sp. C106]|uniref:ATP-binding cassette domain-containing protein n=1 Tax=Actinotalea sp. C106 TaxID=2908644 RepID=UPI002028A593|nr:ABC transporter ATP-binding protein [Actinotalea sp. C106]
MTTPSLEVSELGISINGRTLVDGVSFTVGSGERVCLLGESGSGKSLTANAVLGRLPANAVTTGSIRVSGIEVLGVPTGRRADQARVAMVFQDSAVALNPLVRLGEQIVEPLRRHRGLSRPDAQAAAVDLATSVGLPDPEQIVDRYSGELSGGQRQRICIALALACRTRLLIADEPTSALDVVTQHRVLEVLRRYTAGSRSPALLFITHDVAAASALCGEGIVMKDGAVVEHGPMPSICADPAHPYTRGLVRAAQAATISPAATQLDAGLPPRADDAAQRADGVAVHRDQPPFYAIDQVSRAYRAPRSRLLGRAEMRTALAPTSLSIRAGERVGIVGVSGSGKTTLLRLMLALERSDTGTITCDGAPVAPAGARRLRWYRRKVQYVPQDPASSLDPLMTVENLVREPLVRLGVPGDHVEMVREALSSVQLDEGFLRRRVGELSGGQAQRLAIARAVATRPDVLLADEPVSGLDLPMREQIIAVLREVCATRGTGIVVVSHDLSVIASLCDRTLVMSAGEVVEDRPTAQLLADPHHPRTRELLDAVPALPVMAEAAPAAR